jgi:hypothetical protein
MIDTCYVDIDNNTFEQYDYILSKFNITNNSEWLGYKREILISNILDDNSLSLFDLSFIINVGLDISVTFQKHNLSHFYIEADPPDRLDTSLLMVSSVIESLNIGIIDNEVKYIKAKIRHLTTHWGKILTEMKKSGVKFKLAQVIMGDKVHKFYLTESSKSDERNIKINQILE